MQAGVPKSELHEGVAPMSSAQLRMMHWQALAPDVALYNLTLRVDIDGQIDRQAIESRIGVIVRRHGALRTRWEKIDQVWWQRVGAEASFEWTFEDRSNAAWNETELDALTDQAALRPFDLTVEPALRALLVSLSDRRHLLVLTVHHSACDGWSLRLLMEEWDRLTEAARRGESPALPPAPQYLTYSQQQMKAWRDGEYAEALRHWVRRLRGAPLVTTLPTDRPRPQDTQFRGALTEFVVSDALRVGVHRRAREHGCTPFVIYLAAWQWLLHEHTGQSTTVTGVLAANRRRAAARRVVGYLANTLAMRADFEDRTQTVATFIDRIRDTSAADLAREHVPLEMIIEALRLPRSSGLLPLVQTAFILQPFELGDVQLDTALGRARIWNTALARFDLSLELHPLGGQINGALEFNAELYEAAAIERLGRHYLRLLEVLCDDPTLPLCESGTEKFDQVLRRPDTILRRGTQHIRSHRNAASAQRALEAHDHALEQESTAQALEQLIWRTWHDLLRRDDFGVHDDFFLLGGHSLLANQVVARLRLALGIDVPLRGLFDRPTIRELANWLRERGAEIQTDSGVLIERQPRDRPQPVTESQRRMWLAQQIEPAGEVFNMALAARLRGALDFTCVERALEVLVQRHEALRTRIIETDGEVMQVVEDRVALPLQTIDLSAFPTEEAEYRAATDMRVRTREIYDLARAPLFRAALYRLGPAEHLIYWGMHHTVGDDWSIRLLFQEMAGIYEALHAGHEPMLPAKTLDLMDYAAWQRRQTKKEDVDLDLAYWTRQLEGITTLPLPTDRPRLDRPSSHGDKVTLPWPKHFNDGLRTIASRVGASPFMVMLAAFQYALSQWCRVDDVAVGTPIANRTGIVEEQLIGSLVNTVVMRTNLSGASTPCEVVQRVRQVALNAYAHQHLPFDHLVEALAPRRSPRLSPLFQVFFNVPNAPIAQAQIDGIRIEEFEFDTGTTQFDLSVSVDADVWEQVRLTYSTELFDEATIARFGQYYLDTLGSFLDACNQRLDPAFTLMARDNRLLSAWNNTGSSYDSTTTIHAQVAAQASRTPNATALVQPGIDELSYADLHARSNRLARALRTRGIGRGAFVGLCVDPGLEMVVAQLAILKAGAAYVPLDPAYPSDRLTYMAADAQPALLISESTLVHALHWPRDKTLLLDIDLAAITAQSDSALTADIARDAQPLDPAYVIYTSGSTGQPKGVVIHHQAVVNFLTSMAREPGLSPADRLLAVTTLSFDIAVLELLLPLTVGARVVLASRDDAIDGSALGRMITARGITVLQATPSTWRMLIESGWNGAPGFKALIGGESLPVDLAEQLLTRCSEVWNMYGPTETTVWSTCWRVRNPRAGIRIGHPIANTSIHILDERLQPCPIGVPGEICIGGDGVALGYHRRDKLTAERFVAAPPPAGSRLYRTGDQGRWCHDGTLEHRGRIDFQVKLRGYRIELGEIEAQLLGHASVARAVVIVREDEPDDQRLVSYVVPKPGAVINPAEIRAHLQPKLPNYMLPQHYIVLEALPLLPNGKVDRHGLPEPNALHVQDDILDEGFAIRPGTAEDRIAQIWARLLRIEHIARDDNFFDLGGHSMLAVRAVNQINRQLGINITVRQLIFETLGQIATALPTANDAEFQPTAKTASASLAPNQAHASDELSTPSDPTDNQAS